MSSRVVRLHDIAGRDVIARAESAKVGTVADVLFSPRDGRIAVILLETMGGLGSLVKQRKAVPADALLAVGPDAVMIRDRAAVLAEAESPERAGTVSALDLKGRMVVTDAGERVGKVTDFNFDVEAKRVTGYVVGPEERERGPLRLGPSERPEQRAGERVVPVRPDVIVGQDLITIPAALTREPAAPTGEGEAAGEPGPTRAEGLRGPEGRPQEGYGREQGFERPPEHP